MEETFHLGTKAIIINDQGKILVLEANVKSYNRPVKPHWDLPGGRIQKNESLENGLKRELREEIGLQDFKIIELLDASISNHRVLTDRGLIGLVLFTYLCSTPPGQKIELTDDEHLSYKWADPKKAAQLLADKFSKQCVEKISGLSIDQ